MNRPSNHHQPLSSSSGSSSMGYSNSSCTPINHQYAHTTPAGVAAAAAAWSSSSSSSSTSRSSSSRSSSMPPPPPGTSAADHHRPAPTTFFSKHSFDTVLAGLNQECEALRVELERLEGRERQLAQRVLPSLQQQHDTWMNQSRQVHEHVGQFRCHQRNVMQQQQVLQQQGRQSKVEMEDLARNEIQLENKRRVQQQEFVKTMERKREQLLHCLTQEQDYMWQKLLNHPDTIAILQKHLVGGVDDGAGGERGTPRGSSTNKSTHTGDDDAKATLESSIQQWKQAWNTYHTGWEIYKQNEEEKMDLRAFVLEHAEEIQAAATTRGDNIPVVTEDELLRLEQVWAQQQEEDIDPTTVTTTKSAERDDGDNHFDGTNIDPDRILMPPPPPPQHSGHIQLFYGESTLSQQSSSSSSLLQPDSSTATFTL